MYVLFTQKELEYLLDLLLNKTYEIAQRGLKENIEEYTRVSNMLKQVQKALIEIDKEVNGYEY